MTPQTSLIRSLESIVDPLPLEGLFNKAQPLEVELGSGDGSFLVEHARQNLARNFIGVERLLGRLRKIDRKARRAGLQNLALFRIEAAYFVEYLLPADSIVALHVYFPDPWPKRRHRHHRLVNERFPELAARVLQADGELYLRTDDLDYFQQMESVFAGVRGWERFEEPGTLLAVQTDFERGFRERGLPIYTVGFRRERKN